MKWMARLDRALESGGSRAALFFIWTLAVFLRSPTSNWIFDEGVAIVSSQWFQDGAPLSTLFKVDFWGNTPPVTIGIYRPLPLLIWKLISLTGVLRPVSFLLANLICFTLILEQLFSLFTEKQGFGWTPRGALLSTALCSLCAQSSEALFTFVALSDLLVALFALVALRACLRPTRYQFLVVGGASFLAFLSKESAWVTMPVALVAGILVAQTRSLPRLAESIAAFVVAFGCALWLRLGVFGSWLVDEVLFINNPLVALDGWQRVAGALGVFFRNTMQFFFPVDLRHDYSFPVETADWSVLQSAYGAVMVVAACVVFIVRKEREVRIGLLLWLPSALVVSNLLRLMPAIRAERFLFASNLGLSILLAFSLGKIWQFNSRRRSLCVGIGAWALLQVVFIQVQRNEYRSDFNFWRTRAEDSIHSAKSALNYSVMLGARGRVSEALPYARQTVELHPEWANGYIYLGNALCSLGQYEEAFEVTLKGLRLDSSREDLSRIAVECLELTGALDETAGRRKELLDAVAFEKPGSWYQFLLGERRKASPR